MSQDQVTQAGLFEILKAQKFKCALTGEKLTPDTASADHKIPWALGGEHVLSNIQMVTRKVNAMKGALGNDEFIELCYRIAKYSKRK